MRWKTNEQRIGDVRIHKRFAWVPIEINGHVRWLETVTTEQIFVRRNYIEDIRYVWQDIRFIDEKSDKIVGN